jgi:putative oxidoreductase
MSPPLSYLSSKGSTANILIRLVSGGIFLNEGILKFLDPATNGAGRFATIGIPAPEFFGPFVASVEVLGGIMLILGWLTRIAVLALFINISVAIFTTKIPVLLGHGYLGFALMKVKTYGLLSMVHEARTDLALWFSLLFLLLSGPGRLSIDARRDASQDNQTSKTGKAP